MPDNAYDLAIVDPPYGIGEDGGKQVEWKSRPNSIGKEPKYKKKFWDNARPREEYFTQLFRVSTNQIIWGGNYFDLPPTRGFIIWDKGEGFKNRTYAECEYAWTSFDRNAKIYKRDPLARGDYHGKINPCQKPIQLYKWLLKNYAKPGDKILDTYFGSLSVGIACWDYGYDLDAFEIDRDYFEAGKKRLDVHRAQLQIY